MRVFHQGDVSWVDLWVSPGHQVPHLHYDPFILEDSLSEFHRAISKHRGNPAHDQSAGQVAQNINWVTGCGYGHRSAHVFQFRELKTVKDTPYKQVSSKYA